MFSVFTASKPDINAINKTKNGSQAEKQKACSAALRQWWLELQHQLEAQAAKSDDSSDKFLIETTDTLQPLLDIAFFRCWDMAQERKDGERYISVEQTFRFVDDLVRENQDVAVVALKDYVKYKMVSGVQGNEPVAAKMNEKVDAAKKVAVDAFDLETADKNDDISIEDLEKAIAAAKENKVEEDKVKGPEEKLKKKIEAKAKKEKLDTDATNREAAKKVNDDAAAEKDDKLKAKLDAAAKKRTEDDEKKKEKDELAAKDPKKIAAAKDAAEKVVTDAEERAKLRATTEEDAGKAAGDAFTVEFKAALDVVLAAKEVEYKLHPFINRQAARAKFVGWTATKNTITQNELNKIFNLETGDNFNEFAKELGFNPDSFDDAVTQMDKMNEPPKEEDEEKK